MIKRQTPQLLSSHVVLFNDNVLQLSISIILLQFMIFRIIYLRLRASYHELGCAFVSLSRTLLRRGGFSVMLLLTPQSCVPTQESYGLK